MAKAKQKRSVRDSDPQAETPVHTEIALDGRAKEILELTVLLLARRNYSRDQMRQHFEKALTATPAWVGDGAGGAVDPDDIPGEVLTRWHLLRRYSLDGKPRPLPVKGRLSLTSLIRSISRQVDPQLILNYLTSTNAVRLEKELYLPQERAIRLRRDPRLQRLHHVRLVRYLLRTVEGNARRQEELRRFELIAEGVVPRSQYQGLAEEHGKSALSFLEEVDRDFLMHSETPLPERDKLRMAVGVFFSDNRPLPPLRARRPHLKKDSTR
jgi:hypothetical protein